MIEHENWIILPSRHWYFFIFLLTSLNIFIDISVALTFPLTFSWESQFHLGEKTTPERLHSTPQRWWPKQARQIAPWRQHLCTSKKTSETRENPALPSCQHFFLTNSCFMTEYCNHKKYRCKALVYCLKRGVLQLTRDQPTIHWGFCVTLAWQISTTSLFSRALGTIG